MADWWQIVPNTVLVTSHYTDVYLLAFEINIED